MPIKFLRPLFGRSSNKPDVRSKASHGPSLEAEILAASQEPIPKDWDKINGENDALRFTLRFPLGWTDGVAKDRELGLGNLLVVRPPSAQILNVDGKQAISPSIVVASKLGGSSGMTRFWTDGLR